MTTSRDTSPGAPEPGSSASEHGRRLLGAAAWVTAPAVWLVLQIAAALQWRDPASDWTRNYVSDLGNTTCGPFQVPGGETTYVCSPSHELMNTGFVVSGVLTALGAVLLWRYWPRGRLTRITGALWVLTGAGRVLVGLAPEDVDITLHMVGALVQSPSSVAVILGAIAVRNTSPALHRIGIALGGRLGITAFHLGLGPGLPERLTSHPGQLWIATVGVAVPSPALRNLRRREITTPA